MGECKGVGCLSEEKCPDCKRSYLSIGMQGANRKKGTYPYCPRCGYTGEVVIEKDGSGDKKNDGGDEND